MANDYKPISKRSGQSGDTTITTFNLYNLFDEEADVQTKINGEWQRPFFPTQLAKLSLAIQFELGLPEIIAVQEVSSQVVLQKLANQVNQMVGSAYEAIAPKTSDRRGIQIGFLYDTHRVDLVDFFQMSGPDISAAFGPQSPNPGREPLVAIFLTAGQEITIINNHFKSNHIPDALTAETKQILQMNLAQRNSQAQAVRDYVNKSLSSNPETCIMVTGDLNTSRRGGDHAAVMAPLNILAGSPAERPLTNLLPLKQDIHEYTFIWEGENEILDHIFVSPALLERYVGIDVLHFNAGYAESLWFDEKTAVRCSDHDPLEARFQFRIQS